jgi:hypothetical protein
MKAKVGTSFGLALLLAIGVIATMLALGMLTPQKVTAAQAGIVVADGTQVNVPDTPGANATYTMSFRNHEEMVAQSDQIYVKFAFTIGVPSTIEKERITISASGGGISNPVFDPQITASDAGEPIIVLTIGDTDPTTVAVDNLIAYIEPVDALAAVVGDNGNRGNTTNTNSGHVLQFSKLAGITNSNHASNSPTFGPTYVSMSDNGTTYGARRDFTVQRWLQLSSTSAAKGKVITLTGKAYEDGGTATIWLDGDRDGVIDTDETVLGTSDANIAGGSFTASFTVGDSFIVGANYLNAIDGTGTAAAAPYLPASPRVGAQEFIKRGSISVSPTSASRGETISITLDDFGASTTASGKVLTVTFGGAGAALPTDGTAVYVNSDGFFSIAVPSTTPLGTQQVRLTSAPTPGGSSEGPRTSTITIIGGFAISASPATAVSNQTITVSGSGFQGSGTVIANSITVSGVTVTHSPITIDDSGNLITTFSLPSGDTADPNGTLRVAGDHEVLITDSAGRIGIATITVPAKTITLDPTDSRRGSTVAVTGSGFSASTTVTILHGTITVATVTADSAGNLPAGTTFVVPSAAPIPSTNTVTARIGTPNSGTNRSAFGTHTVPGASMTITPTSVASGETISVTGLDFPGFVSLSVLTIGGISALPTTAPATASDGSFSASVLVPALATGTQTVLITAGGTSSNLPITITAAPATPAVTTGATEDTFAAEITADNLVRVWWFSNANQAWSFFDPRPAFAAANTYTSASSGDIVWVNVTVQTTFQGATLYPGWNLIALNR